MKIKNITKKKVNTRVYNIGTVPNHTYLAEDIVVHNCYQGSTPEGKHASLERIRQLESKLSSWGTITEYAIGGGEPTQHPDFDGILRILKNKRTIVNFTTRIPADQWSDKVLEAVKETVTGIAYSVDKVDELRKFIDPHVKLVSPTLDSKSSRDGREVKLYFHLIPELMNDDDFRNIIAEIEEINRDYTNGYTWNDPLVHVTLLGLKNIGRASGMHREPRPEIIDIIVRTMFTPIGIDTKFAYDYQTFLDSKGIDRKLYTTEEGVYSMYVNAVKELAYKSSYELDNPISLEDSRGSLKYSDQIFKELKEIEQ
jgi:organic radical activating enzyme